MTTLHILTGLPGSGKTRYAAQLLEREPGMHVAMDNAVLERGLSLVDYEARFALQPQVEATQGMDVALAADLTIVADRAQVTKGLSLTSVDGEAHTFRLIATDGGVVFSGSTSSDEAITTQVSATGDVAINGPAALRGQVIGSGVQTSGSVELQFLPTATPGVTIG